MIYLQLRTKVPCSSFYKIHFSVCSIVVVYGQTGTRLLKLLTVLRFQHDSAVTFLPCVDLLRLGGALALC